MDPIVTVGGGPATVHLLAELAQAETLPANQIIIFDDRPMPEGGTPHSDPSPAFRVNMRTELHDIPGFLPFQEFLNSQGGTNLTPPLRWDLGRYSVFVAEKAKARLRGRGCRVTHVPARAVRIRPASPGFWTVYGDGGQRAAGRVILATGNPPPLRPSGVSTSKPMTFYTGDSRFAADIQPSDRVLVIGTGPGAIDVARHLLEQNGQQTPVALVSRYGMLSAVQTAEPVDGRTIAQARHLAETLENRPGQLTYTQLRHAVGAFLNNKAGAGVTRRFLESIRQPGDPLDQLLIDIAEAQAGGPAWRLALEAVGMFAPQLWRRIGPPGQAQFLRKKLDYRLYYTRRHAMQMGTALWLAEAMRQGRISVGRATTLPPHDRVVIACGPEYRVSKTTNPLLREMLDSGISQAYRAPDGFEIGGLATDRLRLISAPGIWAIGALARGEDFAIHSYPALAKHARIIVAQL